MDLVVVVIIIGILMYLIFHSRECTKHGCKPCIIEKFQQILGISPTGGIVSGGESSWIYIGDIYSQKAGKTGKMMLEKNQNPFQPNVHKYRGVDVSRKIFIPIDTNDREIRDGQLISIQGYEDSNPFLVELTKSMKYQYNLASY